MLLVVLSGIVNADPCVECNFNANKDYTVEDIQHKSLQEKLKAEKEKLHEQRLARERAKIEKLDVSEISGVATVSVSEYYDYNLGGTQSYVPSLYVSVYNFGKVDSISLKLQLPKNINPVLGWSDVQVKYKYNSSTGILGIEFIIPLFMLYYNHLRWSLC